MVSYANSKKSQISFYPSEREALEIEQMAKKSNRSVSNFVYNKLKPLLKAAVENE